MKTLKGPGIHLAQFSADTPPFDNLSAIGSWAAELGFKRVQIPTWDRRLFDLEQAAHSQDYCDEVKGTWGNEGWWLPNFRPTCKGS
jgi:sugar phosphate isomerase/epimerase